MYRTTDGSITHQFECSKEMKEEQEEEFTFHHELRATAQLQEQQRRGRHVDVEVRDGFLGRGRRAVGFGGAFLLGVGLGVFEERSQCWR